MADTDPSTTDLLLGLTRGRDIRTRAAAAKRIQDDAATIKRLRYALNRCAVMAENAAYRIGRPGRTPDLAAIQQGFTDIKAEADEALNATPTRAP
jgi:hypothetical protein